MGRPLSGQIIESPHKSRGRAYAVRIYIAGERRYFTVGYADSGWTRARARAVADKLARDVRDGWTAPRTPPPDTRQRREKPDAATAYAYIRRAAQALDYLYESTDNAIVRLAARDALSSLYRAEDDVGRALRA